MVRNADIPERATVRADGAIELPEALRERLGLREGSTLAVRVLAQGLCFLVLPATEGGDEPRWPPAKVAEYLLNNALDDADYAAQRAHVRDDLWLDPDAVPHFKPDGTFSDALPRPQ